jgi:hypothetical protein
MEVETMTEVEWLKDQMNYLLEKVDCFWSDGSERSDRRDFLRDISNYRLLRNKLIEKGDFDKDNDRYMSFLTKNHKYVPITD